MEEDKFRGCLTCEDVGYIDDPTACGDPDHCFPWRECPDCWKDEDE